MEAIVPYLNFNGNAAEALEFYSKVLEGSVAYSQTYGDSPMPVSEEQKNRIMHATFKAGDLIFMCSDTNDHMGEVSPGTNVSLSLNFQDVASIDKTFNALSEDGNITMPLQDTFWGARFGMITDKYGFHWMFNHDIKKPD